MKLKELFLKRYLSKEKIEKGYFLRIRKAEENKINIKVYYLGFKFFDLDIDEEKMEEKLSVNSAVFIPNSDNVLDKENKIIPKYRKIPKPVQDDVNKIVDYIDIRIGSGLSYEGNTYNKLDFELSSYAFDNFKIEDYKEEVEKLEIFCNTDLKNKFVLVPLNEKDKYKISMLLNKNNLTFEELYKLKIKLLEITMYEFGKTVKEKKKNKENVYEEKEVFKRYFKNIDLELIFSVKNNIKESDLTVIEESLENRFKIYAGIKKDEEDYKNTKSEDNQEKQMQQDFMVKINNLNNDDIYYENIVGNKEILYKSNIKPFELEYVIYTGKENTKVKEEKRSQKNIKGRIDNTFVEDDKAVFVEIKYGTSVIDKSNGIHKHLIDIYSCLNMDKEGILKEYEERVNVRNEIETNKNSNVKINNIRYDIVCIYDKNKENDKNLSKKAVEEKIDSIYYKDCYGAKIKRKDIKLCKKHNDNIICKHTDYYCEKLLYMNIPELIEKIKELGCNVKIILVDNEFEKFEEYKPKK